MKILCLQLARLGDILNTGPALKALQRKYPQAKIDILVRERYRSAAAGLSPDIQVKVFDTRHLLGGLASDNPAQSIQEVSALINELRSQEYDLVINWSFSNLSSFIVSYIEAQRLDIKVQGYSRFSDKSLKLCDPVSSYFLAQVGIERSNRIHVIDLFAGVANVQLIDSDWFEPREAKSRSGIVIHVGASENHKRIPADQLRLIIRRLLDETLETITLIGTQEERSVLVGLNFQELRLIDLVGKTDFQELFDIIESARLLIGADSAPIHIATLVNTPTVNVSFGRVNFWETGPKASYSRIISADNSNTDTWLKVVEESMAILQFQTPKSADVYVDGERQYVSLKEDNMPLESQLLNWLYFGGERPSVPKRYQLLFKRISELANLGMEQVFEIQRRPKNEIALQILDQVDRLLSTLQSVDELSAILIRYFQVRKAEIGPGSLTEVLQKTKSVYDDLALIVSQLEPSVEEMSLGVT